VAEENVKASTTKKKTIEDLNKLYSDSIAADRDIFAEQRSNVMLISGQHYSGKTSKHWNRIREARDIPTDQKIRLTKNHIQKITKSYINNITSAAPGVQIIPRNDREQQDIKVAQLNNSVWQYAKDTLGLNLEILSWAKNFIDIGECGTKTFWNPNAGPFKGYQQAVDEMGNPVLDETGQPAADMTKPLFQGLLEIEEILPSNLLRDANATSFKTSPWKGIRKMVPYADMKNMVGEDVDKLKMIEPSEREEFMVFDTNASDYTTVKGQVLVIEYYFKPCPEYPMGYFYITTKAGILFEGELPYGVDPIDYEGFDSIQSSPRHRSIVKQLRPYQMEINRTASKIAEHQVTSDDKVLIQSGTKISSGGVLPGVRAIQYSGNQPTILEGRAGAQYVDYMKSQIDEMYQVANLLEDMENKPTTSADPYGLLFRSVKEQKKFTIYAQKFEAFLTRVCLTYLRLAKKYFTDDMLIPMVGKSEYINLAEFRNSEDVRQQIKAMPMSDDINTMFGKWMAINHMIQYAGNALSKEDIGRLARNIPYGNFDESFSDVTMDYDLAQNYILALDRGQWIPPSRGDNKVYMIKRLEKRTRESDFAQLDPRIQEMYRKAKEMFGQMEIDEKLAIQRAEQGFIPTGGPLIKTDLQVQVPNSTGGMKTERKAFSIESLTWLDKQLQVQGSNLQDYSGATQATQAEIARQFDSQSQVRSNVPGESAPNDLGGLSRNQQQPPAQAAGVPNGIGQPNQSGR
jgi:hypothetical protein